MSGGLCDQPEPFLRLHTLLKRERPWLERLLIDRGYLNLLRLRQFQTHNALCPLLVAPAASFVRSIRTMSCTRCLVPLAGQRRRIAATYQESPQKSSFGERHGSNRRGEDSKSSVVFFIR